LLMLSIERENLADTTSEPGYNTPRQRPEGLSSKFFRCSSIFLKVLSG
jgi:hypothetical protein